MKVKGNVATATFDGHGQPIHLGRQIARGGEGSILEIVGQPGLVAKLYHRHLDNMQADKLATMVRGSSELLVRTAAWPLHTIHSAPGGPIIGFSMPRVSGYLEVHMLHGPKSRLQHFPTAGWPFLLRAAANAARAFSVIHQHGHVVGDVNDRNLLVSQTATTRLIDCDSFQIGAAGRTFPCGVGVPTHTPPELQGKRLRDLARTPNHDAFGLAIIIFQLLFMGRHPFAGRPLIPGEVPIERAIGEYRFAYGPRAVARGMQAPPAAAPLSVVPDRMATLFERAFSAEGALHGRPGPQEWVTELEALAHSLRPCATNPAHHYLKSLASCPWCALQAASGVTLFATVLVVRVASPATSDVDALWHRIEAIVSPGVLPPLPQRSAITVSPSSEARALGAARKRKRNAAIGIAAASIVVVIVASLSPGISIVLIVIALLVAFGVSRYGSQEVEAARTLARHKVDQAEQLSKNLEYRWNNAGPGRFEDARNELQQAVHKYRSLPALRAEKLRKLETSARERQFKAFLDSHRIHSGKIPGIGPSRVATLQSYGIETAADVSNAIAGIPGFGPVLAGNVLAWRHEIETRFRFNPTVAVSKSDLTIVEQEIEALRVQIVSRLQQGAPALERIRTQTLAERNHVQPLLESTLRALMQAEADIRAL